MNITKIIIILTALLITFAGCTNSEYGLERESVVSQITEANESDATLVTDSSTPLNGAEDTFDENTHESSALPQTADEIKKLSEFAQIYILAYDELINIGDSFDEDTKYINIVFMKNTVLTDDEKQIILCYFKYKYNVEVYEKTIEEIREKENITETIANGISLFVNNQSTFSETKAIVHCGMHPNQMNTIGFIIELRKVDEKWRVISTTQVGRV